MESGADEPCAAPAPTARLRLRGRLFRKYVALFVSVVCLALVTNGLIDIWFSYQEHKRLLVRIQTAQAEAASDKISQFVKEIEGQMAWATQLPWSANSLEEWRFDAVRMMRQLPAITSLAQLDVAGREQIRVSRFGMDVVGSNIDYSRDPKFVEAVANKIYYGPVYFLRESEPFMTLAMGGVRRDYGVVVAEVNLKFIGDLVSQIKVGNSGQAYLVDARSRLIAHPDIGLVLQNTNLTNLAQVRAAQNEPSTSTADRELVTATDLQGRPVLAVYARVPLLNWLVFVELPNDEAYAPLYASIIRSGALLLAALLFAFSSALFITRRMIMPIRMLHDGAARIGSRDLSHRISIKSGDELEALGDQFNSMASRLEESYATLERKVEERTHQLALSNLAKSRFLAAASHDLRQPLHALGLFVAQLRARMSAHERGKVVDRIDAALASMNELFMALLDISKIDAGVLIPNKTEFAMAQLLDRIETTFAGAADEKGLKLRIVASSAWISSDFVLLERIVFNLVSNAIRYTVAGGVVVGCRKRGERLRIEVWDTGAGIPADQHQNIFNEFYRLGEPDRDRRAGLGLGLAIVERLCRLLDHPIELASTLHRGSCFSVSVPLVAARAETTEPAAPIVVPLDVSKGKLVVVIDDDPLVLDGMSGLLRSWGCQVVTGDSESAALTGLSGHTHPPDLIVSDYHLADGQTGIEVIERLRNTFSIPIPAFLVSGDTNSDSLHIAGDNGYPLLHKPVDPMTLRAMVNHALKKKQSASALD